MASSKDFSYKVGVDPTGAIKGLRDVQRAAKDNLGDVSDELDEGERNAKALADAFRQMATKVEDHARQSAKAAGALGKSLGPELRAQLGDNGVDALVRDLTKAGLSFDDIEKNADDLADGITRLKQAGDTAGPSVAQEFDKVETSAAGANKEMDKSKSVVANFAGNAAQDLPGVSGAFGALNVAVGQFAEYATEGDIKMKNLVMSAAGLGLATGGFMLLSKVLGDIAKAKEEARRQTKAFAEALKEEAEGTTDAVNALIAKELVEKKVTAGLKGLGVSTMDVARVIKGESVPAFDKLTEGLSDTDLAAHTLAAEQKGLTEGQAKLILTVRNLSAAHAKGADVEAERIRITKELGLAVDGTAEAYRSGSDEVARFQGKQEAATRAQQYAEEAAQAEAKALDEQEQATRDAADASRDLEDALQDRIDTIREATDKDYALRKATDESKDAYEEYTGVIKNRKSTMDERQEAQDKAYFAYLDEAAAVAEAAKAQEELAGGTQTASEKAQIQVESLDKVIAKLDPASPLRKQLVDYRNDLLSVPGTVTTEMKLKIAEIVREDQNALKDRQLAADDAKFSTTVNVYLDGKKVADALQRYTTLKDSQLVDGLVRYQSANGPIPIRTSG